MSLPNLETVSLSSQSHGFWEIGNYRANVQRIHQGSEQLDELARFIKERISIENNYAKHLERWNDDWSHYSEKHLSDGSIRRSFDLILGESKELAKVHSATKDRFNDEVLKTIELFKKDNYHRSTFRGFKEAKEVEDEFEKAQKQWKKLSEKVEMAKRNYHSAVRAEKSAYIQLMNSKADNFITDGTGEKARERHEKSQEETKKTRSNYEQLMQEITTYNNVYIENMAFVFEKCQQMEMKRLRFALEMLSGMQKILVDLVNPPKLAQIHSNLHRHFQQTTDATIGEDLKRWSRLHGVDCATKWPKFEEYTPEFRHISSSSAKTKLKKQQEIGVVLTKKVAKGEDDQSRPTSFTNGNDDGRGRGHIKKNSTDSQQLRTTSRSNRSQSEKPHRNVMPGSSHHINNVFQQKKQNPIPMITNTNGMDQHDGIQHQQSGPTYSFVDPLIANPFPMPTPQKKGQTSEESSEHSYEMNKANGDARQLQLGRNSVRNKGQLTDQQNLTNSRSLSDQLRRDTDTGDNNPKPTTNGVQSAEGEEQHVDQDKFPSPLPAGPAQALYDYKPIEDDEIELVKGEMLDIISGPDNLGWCLGIKKSGHKGLFPAGYVCPMAK